MNERYKELAREAGLLVYNPEGVPTKLEKFAELIVIDCAGIAYNNDGLDNEEIGRLILDAFGVK